MGVNPTKKNQVMHQGNVFHGYDGTDTLPIAVIANSAGNAGKALVTPQFEEFEFRPGQSSVDSGAVATGDRTGSGTTTSGTVASSSYWSSWIKQNSLHTGLIDGLAASGIIWGQLTIGIKTGAGTGLAKVTAEIANTANTATGATLLALTGTMSCTTAEIFKTYDLPYLQTSATINAVPFSIRIGAQHSQGGSTVIFRAMESSGIFGKLAVGVS